MRAVGCVVMSVVLVVHVILVLNRGVTAGLVVRVAAMLRVLGVGTALALVPVRPMLGVRVAFVEIVGVSAMLNCGVATVRAMRMTGVIGVLAMCGLRHGRLSGPFLSMSDGVFGDVSNVLVLERVQHLLAVALRGDEPCAAQHPQMLRDEWL
jgi:hypothetical protein